MSQSRQDPSEDVTPDETDGRRASTPASGAADPAVALNRLEGENAVLRQSLEDALEIGNEIGAMSRRVDGLAETVRQLQNRLLGESGPSAQAARLDALIEATNRLRAKVERMPDFDGLALMLERFDEGQRMFEADAARRMSAEANEAAERLHLILTSRTWRLMRPIRGAGRILKRIAGR